MADTKQGDLIATLFCFYKQISFFVKYILDKEYIATAANGRIIAMKMSHPDLSLMREVSAKE